MAEKNPTPQVGDLWEFHPKTNKYMGEAGRETRTIIARREEDDGWITCTGMWDDADFFADPEEWTRLKAVGERDEVKACRIPGACPYPEQCKLKKETECQE